MRRKCMERARNYWINNKDERGLDMTDKSKTTPMKGDIKVTKQVVGK